MKAELKYLLLCEQYIAGSDGKISVINIFDLINANDFPVIHPRFSVVAKFSCEKNTTFKQVIEIINLNDNSVVLSAEKELTSKNEVVSNSLVTFSNTLFKNEGKYWIKITIDGVVISDKNKDYVLVNKGLVVA